MLIEGSVDGLQLSDLTPEGRLHAKIFSVGVDISKTTAASWSEDFSISCPNPDMYKTAHESMMQEYLEEAGKALSFTLHRAKRTSSIDSPKPLHKSSIYNPHVETEDRGVSLKIRMASMCYTHSPRFLNKLTKCASAFKEYMADMANSLKEVATEVALGLVSQQSDFLAASFYGSNMNIDSPMPPNRMSTLSGSQNLGDISVDADETQSFNLKLDAVLQTPVIVIPRKPNSLEVLVAQLGKITVNNAKTDDNAGYKSGQASPNVKPSLSQLYLEIRDMNVFSCNLEKKKLDFSTQTGKSYTKMHVSSEAEMYLGTNVGIPIVHDTVMQITISNQEPEIPDSMINKGSFGDLIFSEETFLPKQTKDDAEMEQKPKAVIQINAKLVSQLKVTLSKHVYEQIMQTVDNVTLGSDESLGHTFSSSTLLADISEESDTWVFDSGGVSALSMEDTPFASASTPHSSFKNRSELTEKRISDTCVKAAFQIPVFVLELRSDFGETQERGLVQLHLNDFFAKLEKSDPVVTNIDFSLLSLQMEDLLQEKNSEHR